MGASRASSELRKSSEILADIMARYPARLETPGASPSPPTQEEEQATMVPPTFARQLLVDQPRTTSVDKVVVRARVAHTAFVHACPAVRRPGREKKPPARRRRLIGLAAMQRGHTDPAGAALEDATLPERRGSAERPTFAEQPRLCLRKT